MVSLRKAQGLIGVAAVASLIVFVWTMTSVRQQSDTVTLSIPRVRSKLRSRRAERDRLRRWIQEREPIFEGLRSGNVTPPTSSEFLDSVPQLGDYLLKEYGAQYQGDGCDWIYLEGVDLYRGRCDLAAFQVDREVQTKCSEACDKTEGQCKAWTSVDNSCFLKSCDDYDAVPVGKRHKTMVSAHRVEDSRCAMKRGWRRREEPEWVRRWRKAYGERQTFLNHKRKAEDSVTYGPIVTIRGERHSGTNWVRAVLEKNCGSLAHKLGPALDSDGAWGWKHGFVPASWTPQTKDVMVILLRSAATWLPKMRTTAYNTDLDSRVRKTKGLVSYLALSFVDNYSNRRFKGVLDLRTAKYADFRAVASRSPQNVIAVRYEDLVSDDGRFLFEKIKLLLPNECPAADFLPVTAYAKFGVTAKTGQGHQEKPPPAYTAAEWTAFLTDLDAELETSMGYRYSPSVPGAFEVLDPPLPTWLTLPRPPIAGD